MRSEQLQGNTDISNTLNKEKDKSKAPTYVNVKSKNDSNLNYNSKSNNQINSEVKDKKSLPNSETANLLILDRLMNSSSKCLESRFIESNKSYGLGQYQNQITHHNQHQFNNLNQSNQSNQTNQTKKLLQSGQYFNPKTPITMSNTNNPSQYDTRFNEFYSRQIPQSNTLVQLNNVNNLYNNNFINELNSHANSNQIFSMYEVPYGNQFYSSPIYNNFPNFPLSSTISSMHNQGFNNTNINKFSNLNNISIYNNNTTNTILPLPGTQCYNINTNESIHSHNFNNNNFSGITAQGNLFYEGNNENNNLDVDFMLFNINSKITNTNSFDKNNNKNFNKKSKNGVKNKINKSAKKIKHPKNEKKIETNSFYACFSDSSSSASLESKQKGKKGSEGMESIFPSSDNYKGNYSHYQLKENVKYQKNSKLSKVKNINEIQVNNLKSIKNNYSSKIKEKVKEQKFNNNQNDDTLLYTNCVVTDSKQTIKTLLALDDEEFLLRMKSKNDDYEILEDLQLIISKEPNSKILNSLYKRMEINIYELLNYKISGEILELIIPYFSNKLPKLLKSEEFDYNFKTLCGGTYSNRVIQEIIKSVATTQDNDLQQLLKSMFNTNLLDLSTNQYSNFVLCTLLESFKYWNKRFIFDYVNDNLILIITASKYGHYLVKNCIINLKTILDSANSSSFNNTNKDNINKLGNSNTNFNNNTNNNNSSKEKVKEKDKYDSNNEENLVYSDILVKTKNLKRTVKAQADFLICHKYGHFVIVDLLEAFGIDYCDSLLKIYIENANKYIYLIYGYAIAKRIFLNYTQRKNNFISNFSCKILSCLKLGIKEALNFNLSRNIVKACLACISSEDLALFFSDNFIKNTNAKTINTLQEISKEVRNSKYSLKDRILIIFEVDKRY